MSEPGPSKEPDRAAEAAPPSDLDEWLTPNSDASDLFVLKKSAGGLKSSPLWRFYCEIIKAKDDINEDDLPKKWVNRNQDKHQKLAACNKCGHLCAIGSDNTAGKFKQTVAGMKSHLESAAGHSITVEDLNNRIKKHEIASDPNPERASKHLKGAGAQTNIASLQSQERSRFQLL